MRYKAVLFDLDGTLLNTIGDLAASANAALVMNGFPERSREEIQSFVGNGVARLIALCLPGGFDNEKHEKVLADFRDHYSKHYMDNTVPYEGIQELVKRIHNAGVKTGVVSNKFDSASRELMAEFFAGDMDVVIGERDGVPRKPAPDNVFAALAVLDCDPADAVYVGDSEVDVLTARNSGLRCLSVTWGFRTEEEIFKGGDTVIIRSVGELEKAILG